MQDEKRQIFPGFYHKRAVILHGYGRIDILGGSNMPILADCHMHTHYSGDSDAPMEAMIDRAVELGLKHICFTEHQDFDFVYEPDEPQDLFITDTDAYQKELREMQSKYDGRINIRFGIELGLQTHITEQLNDYSSAYDFDFIIGSSHLCNHKDPYLKNFFADRDEQEAYHEYFDYIKECISAFSNFDVYGHLDYVLRYGPTKNANFCYPEYRETIDAILRSLIERGKGIELNTSGYSYALGEPHPCRNILLRYKELGGEILTIGSDAHDPSHIASDFNKAAALLTDCGFHHYCVFEHRRPVFSPI